MKGAARLGRNRGRDERARAHTSTTALGASRRRPPTGIELSPPDKCAEGSIQVRIYLESGAVQCFDISDSIYAHLEDLLADGLDGAKICSEWLPPPLRSDPPKRVRVTGRRNDGSPVDVAFSCRRGARAVAARAPSLKRG